MSSVLILDDNVYKLALIKGWVEDAGFSDIKSCLTYQEAQGAFRDKKFDYMLIDYHLGMNENLTGKDFVKECLKDSNFKYIIYSCENALALKEDQKDIVDIMDLRYEINKRFACKQKVKGDTEERFLYQKVCAVSEKVAQHDVIINGHTEEIKTIKVFIEKIGDKMDTIIRKMDPLELFANKNDKTGDQIKNRITLFLGGISIIVTVFLAAVGFLAWIK